MSFTNLTIPATVCGAMSANSSKVISPEKLWPPDVVPLTVISMIGLLLGRTWTETFELLLTAEYETV